MFLRELRPKKDGKQHSYWSLVETARTPEGPRQRTLCSLGELNTSAQARWQKTLQVFNEQGESRPLRLFPSQVEPPENDPNVAPVLLNKVRVERARQFGNCFLGLELWQRLGLDAFWERWLDHERAEVPWSRVAAVLAIHRLCAPGSELAIEERWYAATALDDLLRIPAGSVHDTRLYRCLDRLVPHKTKLERHLRERYGELLESEFDVRLYDLTSSYVEGAAAKDPLRQRGYSRDHRPDCKPVLIALIVNPEGFPLSYETFDGNRADVSTVEAGMRMVERKYGRGRRVGVFDRGIVSEENLAAGRRRQGQYLVGTPRSKLQQFERELLAEPWERGREDVEVKRVPTPDSQETYVLCRTAARREKEKAIRSRFSARIEKALGRLTKRVATGRLKDRGKIERRLGRIQARYPQAADLYQMQVVEAEGRLRLEWGTVPERHAWQEARQGVYRLRTNLPAESAPDLWTKYIQLTEAAAAFRTLKSELSIRPLFPQLEPRVKAHLLVAFLGYALWVTRKHLLRRKNSQRTPARALALLATVQSADIILPTTDGHEIRLRRVTTPSPEQKALLGLLGITLPARLDLDFECSVNSTTR